MKFKSWAFKLLSRAGASTHQLYTVPHKNYPFKLFLLLADAKNGECITADPPCIKDDFTLALQDKYDFKHPSPELLTILATTALCQPTDIGHVEANHASIRRQVTQRSVQTWVCGVAGASAHWVFQRMRSTCRGCAGKAKRKRVAKASGANKGSQGRGWTTQGFSQIEKMCQVTNEQDISHQQQESSN
eukprot:2283222-Amphidinium_carterae.1